MHWRKRLDRKTLTVCFIFLMIFLVLFTARIGKVVGVNEAEMPKYSVGDKWKFNIDAKYEIGMLGTGTFEITEDSVEITQFGKSYVCYEVTLTSGGTVYGEEMFGTWTVNGKTYVQKSDLSEVKQTQTSDLTRTYVGGSETVKIVTETTYNPPLESSGFSLTVGKSWSAATTETKTTETTADGQFDEETETTTYTKSYLVLRTELTTVSAGEFETFVVKATYSFGGYAECCYSLEVGYNIKETYYDETGKLLATFELLEYSYAAPPDIGILLPENKTYTTSSLSLNFTIDEVTSWIGYSLDGQANVTIAGNTTLSGLSDGAHSLIVYAKDIDENIGASEIIYFSIETGLPLWIIIVVIITAAAVTSGIGYVLYKRRKPTAPVAPPTLSTPPRAHNYCIVSVNNNILVRNLCFILTSERMNIF